MIKKKKYKAGFSLVENLIALAIFVLLATIIYQTFTLLTRGVGVYRDDTAVSNLADEYMEIVHNLPYSSVGTMSGNPHGALPDLPNAPLRIVNSSSYKIYYVVNYIDDPSDGTALAGTDYASNDYKQVKLYIRNMATNKVYDFVTNITPKGLENLSNGGALSIKVFNAVGQPVQNATINITNTILSPNINLTRTTDANGNWIEVGLPDSTNGYHVVVTKDGYSSDQTYPSVSGNRNPVKPDSTIANGQITQVSFSIDKLSSLSFQTLDLNCQILSSIGMNVQGAKIIGTPQVLKFNHNYTSDGSGNISLGQIEWDNYTPTLTDATKMVYGSSPIQVVTILPNTSQNFTLLLGPKTTNSLLVIIKDAVTGNPIENADIHLQNTGQGINLEGFTGGSIWSTNSWSGGSGQSDWTNKTKYWSDDGGVGTNIIPTALRLLSYNNGATYVSNGSLISSTYDTGTASTTFTTLNWLPTSQDPATSIKFQIATSNVDTSTTTWSFIGPDGTSGSFYTTPQTTISNSGSRYLRYKVYMSTTNNTKTPVLTSININYVSGCYTPGQVFFSSLASSTGYQITASSTGYTTQIINPASIAGYATMGISMSH